MSKIFDLDFRKGTLIDSVSGQAMTEVGTTTFKDTEKGKAIYNDCSPNYLELPCVNNITTFSIVFATKFEYKSGNLLNGINISNSAGEIFSTYIYSGGGNPFIAVVGNRKRYSTSYTSNKVWDLIIGTFDGTNYKLYINNTSYSLSEGSFNFTAPPNKITLNTAVASSGYYSSGYTGYKAQIYDHILTDDERTAIYNDFLKSYPSHQAVDNFEYPKPTSISDTGLVCAYNFKRSGNSVLDISGNNRDATINGVVNSVKDGLRIITNTSSIDTLITDNSYFENGFTICIDFVVYDYTPYESYHCRLLEKAKMHTGGEGFGITYVSDYYNLLLLGSGFTLFSSSKIPINTKAQLTIVFTKIDAGSTMVKSYIDGNLVSTKNIAKGLQFITTKSLILGNSSYQQKYSHKGELHEFRLYNRPLTDIEIHNLYNSKIQTTKNLDFSNNAVGDTL